MTYCNGCGAQLIIDKQEPIYDTATGEVDGYRRTLRCPNVKLAKWFGGKVGHWGYYADYEFLKKPKKASV